MKKNRRAPLTLVDSRNITGPPQQGEVHRIQRIGGSQMPRGTVLEVSSGKIQDSAHVRLKLPGSADFTDLGDVPVRAGVVELPVPILFLCHAQEDKARVSSLNQDLRDHGILTWFDAQDLLPGDDWDARIENGIAEADYVMVFVSRISVTKTGVVQRELRQALEHAKLRPPGKRYVIPVLLDDADPPSVLKGLQWIRADDEDFLLRVDRAVRDLMKFPDDGI